MRADDFFVEVDDSWEANSEPWQTKLEFNGEFVDALRRGTVSGHEDVDVAQALVDLVHNELEAYGTSGGQRLNDTEISLACATVPLEAGKHDGIFSRGFSSLSPHSWSGSKRRDATSSPSPRFSTGWAAVDEEIRELRRRFRTSSTPQDYRAIGTHCVGVIEALSRTVYDPTRHLRAGETEPPVDKSKQRIDRYIEDALPGSANEELRGLAKRAVAVAHQVKHRTTPSRRDAGIASDTVILLANILRRLRPE
ncbi:hypothetical protein AB0H34_18330 [Saccharopolyspora shandongensis]|uniref:hypothetical protein n=1 Tax=Saccharopolyspora shandongensis TaxID=418495 RepID=UPI0033FFE911